MNTNKNDNDKNILLFCDNYFNDYSFLNNNFKENTNIYLLLDNLNNEKIYQYFKEKKKQKKTNLVEIKDTDELEKKIKDINEMCICAVKKENETQQSDTEVNDITKKLVITYHIRPWKKTFIHFKDIEDEKVQDIYKDLGLINNKYVKKRDNVNSKWKKMKAKSKRKKKKSS